MSYKIHFYDTLLSKRTFFQIANRGHLSWFTGIINLYINTNQVDISNYQLNYWNFKDFLDSLKDFGIAMHWL